MTGDPGATTVDAATSDPAIADGAAGEPVADIDIAGAVRAHRLAAGLTMRELAARAGMSQPFLSNLENSRAMPSIATLYKIANALGVSPREFLPEARTRVQLVRRGQGALGPVADDPGTATTRVVAGAPGRLVEAHTYLSEAGASMGDWFEHDGEDLLYVVRGALLVELGDGQSFELGTGDVLWYEGALAHRWSPVGAAPTELLCVHARPPTGAPDPVHGAEAGTRR
jgi:transcriptional regulator with XRE-family HTH domain